VEKRIKNFLIYASLPLVLTSVAAGSLLSPAIVPVSGQNESSPLYPTNSAPFGVPYNEWIVRWWQWDMYIPVDKHPNTDYTPEKCGIGQNDTSPVWYLAVPFTEEQQAERTCTIPKDKAIITALLSGECDLSDPRITSDEVMKQCATEGNDYGTIQVLLDGVDLKYDMKQNRVMSDFFNITLPENNIFSSPAGTFRAIVEGFFLFLKPLTPGEHELKFKVSVLNPTKTEYNYFQDVTYHLNIR
jgi:hypothetical protein